MKPDSRRRLALAMMLASGFAGLGYQIVWTQQSTLWLGHESAAVLAVVAAFFGGTAVGALALSPFIDRSRKPALWYAACEIVIGLWSLVLAMLLAPFTNLLLKLIGAQPSPIWHWFLAFCGTFLFLLPATASMGATLPAMERVLANWRRQGSSIAELYAANTFGAVFGVLAAAFALVPELGLVRTAGVCAALNLVCALAALKLAGAANASPLKDLSIASPSSTLMVLPLLAATGLLGIGYEVIVVRVLSQVAENTVYSFAILLAVYLIGTALGAAAYACWPAPDTAAIKRRNMLLQLLAASCLLGGWSLAEAETLKIAILQVLGSSMLAALSAEALLSGTAFLLPTMLMGALFSHLSTQSALAGIRFGRMLGVNTLGAAVAPLLFGVCLIPWIGAKFALLLIAAGYLSLCSLLAWRRKPHWIMAGITVAAALWGPSLLIVDVPEGGRILSYAEGVMSAVSVVEDADGTSRLHIDNRQQEGSSATVFADARQALLPLLLHPAPRRVLFLGLGTGVTASSAAEVPGLEVDAVELLPEVIAASTHFTHMISGDAPNPRLHLMNADARRFVRTTEQGYDLIVSDNFHPARSGSGSLYTVEHFEAVKNRLGADGVICQWLPLHQLDLDTLRSIVRSFLAVYPHGWAMLATNSLETPTIGLVARADNKGFSVRALRGHLSNIAMSPGPADFDINDDLALLGSFFAGPRALSRFAGDAPLNTDDHPVVAYRAPRLTYAPDSLPRDRLLSLLHEVDIEPDELLAAPHDDAWESRLRAYWSARNRYIEIGRDVRPISDLRAMLAQVQGPLISVLRISPDFRPAYDPLLKMAEALEDIDRGAACALLAELRQAQPARSEATQALSDSCVARR